MQKPEPSVKLINQFQVGQWLWLVPFEPLEAARPVQVSKVGRAFVYFDQGRDRFRWAEMIDIGPGFWISNSGDVYMSKADYDARVAIGDAWLDLGMAMGCGVSCGVTIADIAQARKLLRLDQ